VDAFGRVVRLDDGLVVTEFELDELGRLVGCGLSDGTQARTEYDRCGRRTLVEDAAGGVLRIEYTAGGRISRQVSPEGREESLEHDACGRISAYVDGAGRRTELRYDGDGAVIEVLMPTGESERFEYDELRRLSQTSTPGAGLTRYAYDAVGRVVAIIDREAGERRFEYDVAGRLVAAVDANGDVTRYAYNECGWLVEITDPLGGTITRGYDAVGRLIEQTDQLGRHTTFTVDAAGKLVELADATGRRTTYAYDISGRMISFGPADEPPHTVTYDGAGRTIAVEEPGALSHRLRWDAEGRLVERRRGDLAMRWTYDADGDRTSIGYPDGTQTTYTRDRGGRVVAAHHPALGAVELERDPAGRLIGASADGMGASWRYAGGDLEQYEMHAGDTQRSALLTRDASGRITQATIDGRPHAFSHDAAGQLVSAHTPAGAWEFGYDANGRLARELSPSGAVEYEYDAVGQLTRRIEAGDAVTSYAYDGAGRRVRERGPALEREYAWDAIGRLTGVTRSGAGGGNPRSTSVVVDVLGELASLDGTAMMWDTADPFAPLAWRGDEAVIGEGSPWALASAGVGRWLAPDWQGTIGDVARDPWGAARDAGGGLGSGLGLGYRGEVEFDGETWLRRRVYQAATRSFPQPDPYPPEPGTASAANPYHYAANDPIGRADPLGLHPISEKELNAIRNRMDRGLLDVGVDAVKTAVEIQTYPLRTAVKLVVDNATTISAVTGVLALVPGPQAPFLAGISIGTGMISAGKALHKGKYGSAALDFAAIVPGVAGLKLAYKARAAVKLAQTENAARLATWQGKSLAIQYEGQLEFRHALHAAHKTHLIGKGLDVVAAGGATAIALKPHGEHEEHVPHEPHPRHPVQLHPVHP